MQSTVLAVTDDLALAVVESGKNVKQLKFEPIFKSFAQNGYFVSRHPNFDFDIDVEFPSLYDKQVSSYSGCF